MESMLVERAIQKMQICILGTPSHDASIVTVDQDAQLRADHMCTTAHTGTSASAPLAAGMCALALEANAKLTWRDMQHVVLLTANPKPLLGETGWSTNAVGKQFSYKFGYGLMDGSAMVDLASKWPGIGPRLTCKSTEVAPDMALRPGKAVRSSVTTSACSGTSNDIQYLEHVQCIITLKYVPRGDLRIDLISPSGTRSSILFPRPMDTHSDRIGFNEWPFLSVHFWGEQASGNWTLEVKPNPRDIGQGGVLKKWQLVFYGTYYLPKEAEQMYLVHRPKPGPTSQRSVVTNSDYSIETDGHSMSSEEATCDGMGQCTCSLNYYLGADQKCHPCHKRCSTCFGPRSHQCLTCKKPDRMHYMRETGRCLETCPAYHMADGSTCKKCPNFCET